MICLWMVTSDLIFLAWNKQISFRIKQAKKFRNKTTKELIQLAKKSTALTWQQLFYLPHCWVACWSCPGIFLPRWACWAGRASDQIAQAGQLAYAHQGRCRCACWPVSCSALLARWGGRLLPLLLPPPPWQLAVRLVHLLVVLPPQLKTKSRIRRANNYGTGTAAKRSLNFVKLCKHNKDYR
jgi:hypothetical protein